jgi:hypothetical protein
MVRPGIRRSPRPSRRQPRNGIPLLPLPRCLVGPTRQHAVVFFPGPKTTPVTESPPTDYSPLKFQLLPALTDDPSCLYKALPLLYNSPFFPSLKSPPGRRNCLPETCSTAVARARFRRPKGTMPPVPSSNRLTSTILCSLTISPDFSRNQTTRPTSADTTRRLELLRPLLVAAPGSYRPLRPRTRTPLDALHLVRIFFASGNHRKHRRCPHLRRNLTAGDLQGTLAR